MVGDGINDAPALASADLAITVASGTDIAAETSDVLLIKNDLTDIPRTIKISSAVTKNIKQNLFWAFIYNIIGIPLAAGLFIPIFGWELNPMFGAAAMSLSSFCVVSNALRLNFAKIYDEIKIRTKEIKTMKKTMKIEGMMCEHCKAHVTRALLGVEGVLSVEVDLAEKTATLTLAAPVADDILTAAVTDAGYTPLSVAAL